MDVKRQPLAVKPNYLDVGRILAIGFVRELQSRSQIGTIITTSFALLCIAISVGSMYESPTLDTTMNTGLLKMLDVKIFRDFNWVANDGVFFFSEVLTSGERATLAEDWLH